MSSTNGPRRAAVAIALLALPACQAKAVSVDPGAQSVDVEKADPPPGSKGLGIVYAVHGSGCGVTGAEGNYEGAVAILRNKAARRGGNYVQVLTAVGPHTDHACYDNRYIVSAVIYRVGSATPEQLAAATCQPPCSPGYACESGTCVAQCSPPCAANETCRQDRTCAVVAH